MNILAAINTDSKKDTLKYAYAFMQSETLNMKECSFMNANPTKFDKNYIVPRDMYSASYSNKVPCWETFKNKSSHLTSPGFVCVASLDRKDQQRVLLSMLDGKITFSCYGDYVDEAKIVFKEITSIYKSIK